jgi:16S rRNA processing protein RimM
MYLIGHVIKAQGVRGELKVSPLSENPDRFRQLDTVQIKINQINQAYSVQQVKIAGRFVFLKLLGIETRDEAAAVRGAEVLIGEQDLVHPSDDEFFVHDLVGCRVYSEKGDLIGFLTEVVQLRSNDVWVVTDEVKKEILIPAIKDIIRQVDLKGKKITIHLIEGLLD